ncbi:hypothetical protein A2223_01295 [Candidatus Falkowbacteria bacterium RIFOXYA2_FULL_35_8]|nr:MAG: hypothetical protein A2223_01295 [Candidatus Falkowbacteria bacterium RIFOXYA2_FULL_35_8]
MAICNVTCHAKKIKRYRILQELLQHCLDKGFKKGVTVKHKKSKLVGTIWGFNTDPRNWDWTRNNFDVIEQPLLIVFPDQPDKPIPYDIYAVKIQTEQDVKK